MLEAFRVGPVDTPEGIFTLYAACTPRGAVSALAPDDRAGLAELRKRMPTRPASCEPSLAFAGKSLGYRSAELSAEAKLARATFLRERPWQLVRPELPIAVTVEIGGRERRFAASVLGADDIEHRVALHQTAEAMAHHTPALRPSRSRQRTVTG